MMRWLCEDCAHYLEGREGLWGWCDCDEAARESLARIPIQHEEMVAFIWPVFSVSCCEHWVPYGEVE